MKNLKLRPWRVLATVALFPFGLATSAVAATPTDTKLIPRNAIFGNPERAGGQISPDGKYVSFLAPRDGVLNVWVVERGKPLTDARRSPTRRSGRSASTTGWRTARTSSSRRTREATRTSSFTPSTSKRARKRTLTDFKGVRVLVYGRSLKRPDELVIGINERDKAFHDPYLLNARTGALKKLFDNTEKYANFLVDDDLNVRFVTRPTPDGGFQVFRYDNGKTTVFETVAFEDSQTTGPGAFTKDGKTLYWSESRGRNTAALLAIDLASGEKKLVAEDPRADVDGGFKDPQTGVMQAYGVNYLKNEWRALSPAAKEDIDFLNANLKGQWTVQSQTRTNKIWLIGNDPITSPARAMIYDREGKSLKELYVVRPALIGAPLPAVCPVEIKSRDGLTLIGYLTLPVGSDAKGDCKPTSRFRWS